ncbi:MAG: inorganic diphosphatase [Armatimonadota bacterium]|nr:inorganic diphosphatase [Armatimonadota bacterium]MDR7452532.1 inorganic diphosphatase [Armatimonadota bacterium]MDR7467759.1 inorganic diphosphatase [Armatimonadota bacterium]MDR7494959.1 inorganic diphosphatase [Armatimonadota bacterium]MDR7499776.1 inorganic diphosphatase [Armatimonadota bacterium]
MIVEALVEIPKGSRNKYEYDAQAGRLRLNRVLYSPLHYPADYGVILDTRAEDGDPLDVLILTYEATFPGCLVPVRPVGVLDMRDEKGRDQKILAVPDGDPRFHEVTDLADLPPHFLAEIRHFFEVYKTLEHKETEVFGWSGAAAAEETVREAQDRFRSGLP